MRIKPVIILKQVNRIDILDAGLKPEAKVLLTASGSKHLRRGGLWAYDNEIDSVKGEYRNGALIEAADNKGRFLAYAFINDNSKLRLRAVSWDRHTAINRGFFRSRLASALELRRNVADMRACRLVFGEADFLPGLTVDKYGEVLVFQNTALALEPYKGMLMDDLRDLLESGGYAVSGIYERSESPVRKLEGLEPASGFYGKEFDASHVNFEENGLKLCVDVAHGQKTGYFLDQRLNRAIVGRLARGLTVLDCFTNSGTFALNAMKNGAKSVTAVDVSADALRQARANAERNQLTGIEWIKADVFELLPQWVAEKRRFGLVILDPPAFTKSHTATAAAVKGYKEINLRGIRLTENGGFLATCTCSHFMGEELFRSILQEAAVDENVSLKQIGFYTQPPDHPIVMGAPESYYLKFFIFQVISKKC